jgi:hypothetical protein
MRRRACTEGPPSIVGSICLPYSVYDQPPHSARLRRGRSVWILGQSRCNGLSIRAVAPDQKICGAPDFSIVQRLLHHKDPRQRELLRWRGLNLAQREPDVQEACLTGRVHQELRERRADQLQARGLRERRAPLAVRVRAMARALRLRVKPVLAEHSDYRPRELTPPLKSAQRHKALFS